MRLVVFFGTLIAAVAVVLPAASATSMTFRIVGHGQPLPVNYGSGPCPDGRTDYAIESRQGTRIGTAHLCVLSVRKTEHPSGKLRTIVQRVVETDELPAGTIVSRQTQIFRFGSDERRARATFRGRVFGGSGRYADARGAVRGSGPAVEGLAKFVIRIRLN